MDPEMLKRLQAGLGGGGGMQPPPMPQGAPPMPQGMPQPGGQIDHEAMRKAMMGAGAPQPPPGMQAPPMNLSPPPAPAGGPPSGMGAMSDMDVSKLAGLFAPSRGMGR